MAFFTGYFQKRALRFALSQLGLFDQDAFDIDSQGISWGTTTIIELRDIPLSIPRLTELLQLPPYVTITASRLQYLKLTLPLNLLSNNVAVEVGGVRLKLLVSHDEGADAREHLQDDTQYSGSSRQEGRTGGVGSGQGDGKLYSRNTSISQQAEHSPQHGSSIPSSPRKPRVSFSATKFPEGSMHGLPTTDDLAESFLAYESPRDRAETRAAIVRDRRRQTDPDELDDVGLGPEISLKAFFSNLAKGVLDRFKASIKDIQIEAVFKVPSMPEGDINYTSSPGEVTFCLDVESIDIPPVDNDVDSVGIGSVPEQGGPTRLRNISIKGIHASLLVTSALSSFMTQLSRSVSPALSRAASKLSETTSSAKSSSQGSRLQSAFAHGRDHPAAINQSIKESENLNTSRAATQTPSRGLAKGDAAASLDNSFSAGFEDESSSPYEQDSRQQSVIDQSDYQDPLDDPQLFVSDLAGSALSASSESFLSRRPTDSPPIFRRGLAFARDPAGEGQSLPHQSRIEPFQASHTLSTKEDLTESKFFSQDQAKSMYASAMSPERLKPLIPGTWGRSDSEQNSPDSTTDVFHDAVALSEAQARASLAQQPVNEVTNNMQMPFSEASSEYVESGLPEDDDSPPHSLLVSKTSDELLRPFLSENQLTEDVAPQAMASRQSSPVDSDEAAPKVETSVAVKTLLVVDSINIKVPPAAPAPAVIEPQYEAATGSSDLPGAFSAYRSMDGSVFSDPQGPTHRADTLPRVIEAKSTPSIEIQVDTIVCCFDMALVRLLLVLRANLPRNPQQPTQPKARNDLNMAELSLNIHLKRFSLRFQENLKNQERDSSESMAIFVSEAFSTTSSDLFRVALENLKASLEQSSQYSTAAILIAKFQLGFPDEDIISFDQESRMRESTRDTMMPNGQDISIRRVRTLSAPDHFEINTTSMHVNANINRLAEMINWLGGLSTVLDLKNSMRSTITITETKPSPTQPRPRGVHFDLASTSSEPGLQPMSGPKINVRIGGVVFDVVGTAASLRIESSALKVVVRDGAIRTQIDRINFHGPLTDIQSGNVPLIIAVDTLQVAYFDLPKEADLTRLLTLLSPSQDRDDQDDDILLDTLLRQRRKGSLLRISIAKAKLHVSQLNQFRHFNTLVEEASQLSSVAKYLPEDDRPGLLIMTRVDEMNIELDVNRNINSLSLGIKNIELALVTFPSLFLVSVGHVSAKHKDLELIGTATPDIRRATAKQTVSQDDLPKVSIKFIAGEMEPTLRVKLYNIRFEYHVSTVMSFLGISETASGEVIVAEMVNSVANLAVPHSRLGQSSIFQQSPSAKDQRPLKLDLSIRDIVFGLNPKDKPAKGLLVFTSSRLSGTYPDDQASESHVLFEINKAHFMVVDNKKNILVEEDITDPNIISGLGAKPTQLQCLEAVGYVSVGQTSAASIASTLTTSGQGNLLNIEVRNHLFVLETCADSTQTLLLVLGSLAPPQPPRKGNKYRTEVVPITDMLASFSGQAFAKTVSSEGDSDEEVVSEDETGTIALDDEEDFPVDLDLDDDFFIGSSENESMASFGIGSVLFKQASKPAQSAQLDHTNTHHEQVDMMSSVLLGADHFGGRGRRSAREWDSYKNKYRDADPEVIRASPLQVSLNDIHFIWHLYDGYDWQKTRDTIAQTVDEIEAKAEERRAARRDKLRAIEDDESETVIGDMLFNSIYIGISAKDDPRDLSHRINGILNDNSSDTGSYATTTTTSATSGRPNSPRHRKKRLRLGRSRHHKMTFELKGVSGNIVSFPPDSGETQSSIRIRVRDLEIFDNIPSSTWRKFATYMHDAGRREKDADMVEAEVLVVKPDPDLLASEFVLKIDVLPLRLHVDQDALDFMTRFFEFRDDTISNKSPSTDIPFIQRAEVGPVQIKLDFKPKRIDWRALRSGKTSEFMNFIILDEADMILRKIILYGVRGFDKLGHTLNDIWTPDVKANQLPGVLAGLAPVRPLINLGSGVRDLVVVPMREYKKDGRLVRAVRKGVMSFGKTTTTELAKLGAKLAIGTHTMLSNAEGLLSPETRRPSSRGEELGSSVLEEQAVLSPYANPPVGVVQGLRGAYRGLERDLLLAKDAIIAMPGEVVESETASGAAAAVLRNAPIVILRPAMGVTKAIGQTLMGATNSLNRTEWRRMEDKYKYR